MNTNRGIVKDLENLIKRQTSQMGEDVLLDAIAEIERLRSERDEARREVCELENLDWIGSVCRKGTKETAVERGWDCFKEETP
jgi:hypothetical protein